MQERDKRGQSQDMGQDTEGRLGAHSGRPHQLVGCKAEEVETGTAITFCMALDGKRREVGDGVGLVKWS